MSVRIGEAIARATVRLTAAGVDGPRRDARLLLAHCLATDIKTIFAYPERTLSDSHRRHFDRLIERRAQGEPVSRILGRREFWSLPLKITDATLDPRPDSECVVEAVLARVTSRDDALDILDLGTGSGCLVLALLKELPRARGLAIDLSAEALAVARDNAAALGLRDRCHFAASDWGAGLAGGYDVIVSNPPYVAESDMAGLDPAVRVHDPRLALAGGADGLDAYRRLLPCVVALARPGAVIALEVGAGRAETVGRMAERAGLALVGPAVDLSGTVRCIVASGPTRKKELETAGIQTRVLAAEPRVHDAAFEAQKFPKRCVNSRPRMRRPGGM